MRVSVPAARYDTPEKVVDFYRQLNDKVRALPGVQSAGFVRVLPLATTIGDFGLDVEGFEERPGANAKGDWQIATDGSFEAMGSRLLRGRWFTPADTDGVAAGHRHQRDDGANLLEESGGRGRRPDSRRQHEEPVGDGGRHGRRRAPQRRHRHRQGEVLRAARAVARRHRRQPDPRRVPRGADRPAIRWRWPAPSDPKCARSIRTFRWRTSVR